MWPIAPLSGLCYSGAMLLDQDIRDILANARTIAVVGAKDKPSPVDDVGRYLIAAGYTVYPVHPVRKTVWGLEAYSELALVPEPVDVVDLFRAAQFCPDHAREVLALPAPPRLFWMQSGIMSREATELLHGTPTAVVQDLCLMIEHRRLLG